MVILKRAQKKLYDLSQIAYNQKKIDAAKKLDEESAVLRKVIAIFEEKN